MSSYSTKEKSVTIEIESSPEKSKSIGKNAILTKSELNLQAH